MSVKKIIDSGLALAAKDYTLISKRKEKYDVKPKEDQIKSALYKAFCDEGYLVHVEASYARNGKRCDLMAVSGKKNIIAIEIKTAWAGVGWVNKPTEQASSWVKDIEKLRWLVESGKAKQGYFVLCFAYQKDSKWETILRDEIVSKLGVGGSSSVKISEWNGLTELQFFVAKAV